MPALSKRAQAGIILCLVLLIRLPFLNQAIQGDDFYYLKAAEHAQIDPLHPNHARYVFLGDMVDMRGHPHPPLNAWYLALLIRVFGEVREVPFHAAYVLFSVIAALSAWAIARRLGRSPLLATVLFVVTPAFVVNGNSLESDVPFVAFWLAAVAAFLYERWVLAAVASGLAAMAAFQAVVLTPILGWWWFMERRWNGGGGRLETGRQDRILPYMAILAAPLTIAAWQIFERLSSGALPATVLAGYMQTYNLQALSQKIANAGALTGQVAWLVFPGIAGFVFLRKSKWLVATAAAVAIVAAVADPNPLFWISCGIGAAVILACAANALRDFRCAWVAIFFAAALVIFFAGSARYLLPIVLPIAILVSDRVTPRWLIAGAGLQAALSIGLAVVNYQHQDGYREFARSIAPEMTRHRTWTNAEWGLRHYLESNGAMPIEKGRAFWPGDLIVMSAYSPEPQAGPAALIGVRRIESAIPLRIVALDTDSAYSSISFGLAPFGVSTSRLDVVRAAIVGERKVELSTLEIGTPAAAEQILSGIYNYDRWMSARGTVVLRRPDNATTLEAKIFIPPQSPARIAKMFLDGRLVAEGTYADPGAYTLSAPAAGGEVVTVAIEFDNTFTAPPDQRELAALLLSIGFR